MASDKKQELLFDSENYAKPAPDKTIGKKPKSPGKGKGTRQTMKAMPEKLQPFLPGLSRRGRPRSKNPIPPSVRASESRKRRVEAGGKRIELLLEPTAVADLDSLVDYYKVTRAELIGRLLAKAARQLRAKAANDNSCDQAQALRNG